jgi:hypothetical protein
MFADKKKGKERRGKSSQCQSHSARNKPEAIAISRLQRSEYLLGLIQGRRPWLLNFTPSA